MSVWKKAVHLLFTPPLNRIGLYGPGRFEQTIVVLSNAIFCVTLPKEAGKKQTTCTSVSINSAAGKLLKVVISALMGVIKSIGLDES